MTSRFAIPKSRASSPFERMSRRWRNWSAALTVAFAACAASPTAATTISFDTTALAGMSARLDFSLIDGDLADGNNTVTIASFATDGMLGAVDCTLSCSGGPPYAITEAGGLGQLLQDIVLGNFLSFDLTFTTNFSGLGALDRLSLLLLDPGTNFSLVDTNLDFILDPVPVQDALMLVDLADGAQIQVAANSNPAVPGTVPIPGTAALIGLGFAALMRARISRRRPLL